MALGAIALGGLRTLSGFNNEAIAILPGDRTGLLIERAGTSRTNDVDMPIDGPGEYLKLTNVGRSTITVRNVLINGRKHCAQLGNAGTFEPPLTLLDMGGWATLRFVCPGTIVRVTVETSRGNATYSWKVAAGVAEK